MSRFFLRLEASAVFSIDTPMLEVLVDGFVVSSVLITAQTGSGSSLFNFAFDYSGNFPSSVSFRFNDGLSEPGRSITIESVRINGTAIDTSNDLTAIILMQSQTSDVVIVNTDHLFGRVEPTPGDLGTPTITGTGGDDTLIGSAGQDIIDGGGGNDTIRGNGGDDKIIGGTGNDKIYGLDGNDLVIGEDGDDRIYGGNGDDLLFGGNNDDTLTGDAGKDVLNGGAGNDALVGGTEDDILYGEAGDDTLVGDEGADSIYGDAGIDYIDGGTGNDLIYGGTEDDYIFGGDDDDDIYGEDGNDYIDGGAGNDTIDGGAGVDYISGWDGNDTLQGGNDDDIIWGDDGADTISGDTGNDGLLGGLGADTINGGTGNDLLYGHALDIMSASMIVFSNPAVSYNPLTNSFYQLVSTAANFDGAAATANATLLNGVTGHLVTINSASENSYVQSLAGGNEIWLGALDTGVEGEWRWYGGNDDGLLFSLGSTAQYGAYTNWAAGQPDDSGGAQDYAVMQTSGAWADIDGISNTRFYVIEWDGADFSDDGAADILNGGADSDLLYGHDGNDTLNGDAGTDRLFGGAGNDTLNGGDDGDYLADAEGTNIFNGGNGNDVLDARFQTAIPTIQEQISSILTNNSGVNYSSATGNFYQFVNTMLDWDVARAAAAATTINGFGGHLGTITSQAEHDFIVGLASGQNTWLGGSDDPAITGGAQFGDWYWVDGPETGTWFYDETTGLPVGGSFINWNPGQPNDSNNTQNYLYLLNSNDQWADLVIEGDGSTGFVTVPQYLVEWEGTDLLVAPPAEPAQTGQTMNGGAGNDTIFGGNGGDTINGDGDDDYIEGRDGNDTIDGGAGLDEIYGGLGSDTITGGTGNDTLYAAFAPLPSIIPVAASFDTGSDGFTYADGVFGSTGSSNSYASGIYINSDGFTANGAVEVTLGGINNNAITNMSGAWQYTFNLTSSMSDAVVSFAYRALDAVVDADPFDPGEDLHLYADIDGTTYSNDANPYFFEVLGSSAGASYDSGWLTITLNIGALGTGNHTLSLGGNLASKTFASEQYDIRFDDVILQNNLAGTSDGSAANSVSGGDGNDTIYGSDGTDTLIGGNGDDTLYSGSAVIFTTVNLLLAAFDAGQDGFSYSDGGFGGSDPPNADATGSYVGTDGNTANGSLEVYIDGLDNNASTNISGNWNQTFNVTNDVTNVQLTLAYRHWHSTRNDNNEDSQVYIEIDGVQYGTGGNNFISEALGSGGQTDTGWVQVTLNIADLAAGNHTIAMGILHTAENRSDEDSYVRFDDVSLTGDETSTNVTVLNGQDGLDNLYGSDGEDHFLFEAASAFNDVDVIHDFNENQNDAIDISDVLSGLGVNAGNLAQYVDISSGVGVRVDVTGSGSFGAATQIASFTGSTTVSDEATMLTNGTLII